MARGRVIKPEICTSEALNNCCRDARLLFTWLLMFCDDSGAHEYSLYRFKTQIFPGDDDITKQVCADLIQELADNDLMIIYELKVLNAKGEEETKKYIRYKGFLEHQVVDFPKYKFPWENGKIYIKLNKKTAEELNNDPRDFKTSSRYRKDLKIFLIDRDGNECRYCGSTTRTLTVDHIIPQSKDGTDHTDNLCLACRKCNTLKGNKLVTSRREFGETTERGDQESDQEIQNNFQVTSVDNSENLDKKESKSPKTDQKIISGSPLAKERRGEKLDHSNTKDISSKFTNSKKNDVNNLYNEYSEQNKKAGRPKRKTKWDNSNWEDIPDNIVAGFDMLYYRNWPPPLKGKVQGLIEYANMNNGDGATEDEQKRMCKAINAQKLEASLKAVNDGFKTYWPRIATWIRNKSFDDDVDLSTPTKLKPKSTANKFADNAAKACQNIGGA